ncbi:MAG TPA: PorV/PorQ family protein [Bacteroidetes bacterium]|nr:PorV/PorQ family protein [Bacteroidota bacterium]
MVIFSININNAQSRKFVNEFLNIGVGAKYLGMFGAVAAQTNDITSGYWNPSGLTGISAPFQVSAMHAEWFAGIAQYDYLAFGKKLGKNGNSFGGLSLIRMGVDNIPNTLSLIGPDGSVDYDQVSSFSAADYALLISYAKNITDSLSIGFNTKVIHRQIGKFATAWGFGFDFGAQWKFKNILVGVMGRDITSTFTSWAFNFTDEEKDIFLETGNEIPLSSTEYALPKIIAGIAYEGGNNKRGISYIAEFDVNISTDGRRQSVFNSKYLDIAPALGLELGFKNKVFVRGGFGNLQRVINPANTSQNNYEVQPNVGVGLKLGRLSIDYALSNVGNLSSVLYSHIFSLSLDLSKK